MHSSTYKNHTQTYLTERALDDINDTQLLDIRLDDFDLEAARSVTDAAKSSSGGPQFPYRSPWIFRAALAPHFELPKALVPAHLYNKIGRVGVAQGQSSHKSPVHPTHVFQSRSSPVCPDHRRAEFLEGWSPNQDPVLSPRTWASCASSAALLDERRIRFSAYERGSVSVRRDFSSSTDKSSGRLQVD